MANFVPWELQTAMPVKVAGLFEAAARQASSEAVVHDSACSSPSSVASASARGGATLACGAPKHLWTALEDARLGGAVGRLGEKSWSEIAALLPGRVGKQCRDRCKCARRRAFNAFATF